MEHFEYCTCTHVESYSINPLIPTIKIHTQMDTHRQLWCSWECNDQRQRPIRIAPVPRCRIIIEYDNTQLSLRIIQNATTRPHDTPTHARLIERARPQDIFSRHVFVLMDINFYKQALQIILPLICHSVKFGECDARGLKPHERGHISL